MARKVLISLLCRVRYWPLTALCLMSPASHILIMFTYYGAQFFLMLSITEYYDKISSKTEIKSVE